MKLIHMIASSLLALVACGATAKEPAAHQHGVAKLQVAVDGKMIEISLESPLDNFVGFERGPRNDKERQAVRAMALRFHDAASLFVPTPEAACTPRETELSSAVIDPGLLAAGPSPAPERKPVPAPAAATASGGHADLDATMRFQCDNVAALKGLDVRLFKAFSGLRRIDASVVSSRGQRGAKLTAGQSVLTW